MKQRLPRSCVAAVFCLILVGFVFLAILWILNTIFVIIAAIQASDGKFYRYPDDDPVYSIRRASRRAR